jgi:serine/threonine protein kinase
MTVSCTQDWLKIPSKALECEKTHRIIREATFLSLLHHPNIVKLHQVHLQDNVFYLIFDYVSGGQLLDYILSHGSLKESQARIFFRQLLSAVSKI